MLNRIYARYLVASAPRRLDEGAADGANLVEYALIALLVAVAAFIILQTLGSQITKVFKDIVNKLGG